MVEPVQHNKPKLWEQHHVLPTFQPTQLSTTNKSKNYDIPGKSTPSYSYNFNESRDQKYQTQNGRLQHNDCHATYWAPFLTKTANTTVYDQQNFKPPSYKTSSSTLHSFNSISRSSNPSSTFTCR